MALRFAAFLVPFLVLAARPAPVSLDEPACVCWLTSGGQVPGGGNPPSECIPISFDVSFGIGNSVQGQCYSVDPNCEMRNCTADIKIVVKGHGPCRFRILRNLSDIGGGWLPLQGEFDMSTTVDLECGAFDVFAFVYAGVPMTSITYLCEACGAGG